MTSYHAQMGTLKTGLVSITFRSLSVDETVALVNAAGQRGIEWGGDVHVPHGDLSAARYASRLCRDAGIEMPSYGSYFRIGRSADEGLAFERVAETAAELGASTIRVWAGASGSGETDRDTRRAIADEARTCAEIAASVGVTLSFEYHGGTLTDTDESAVEFLQEVDHPAVRSYWQPRTGVSVSTNLAGLSGVAHWLSNVHVFHWNSTRERLTLEEGRDAWGAYLARVLELPGARHAMLEFVRDDDPEQYLADARTLESLLADQEK